MSLSTSTSSQSNSREHEDVSDLIFLKSDFGLLTQSDLSIYTCDVLTQKTSVDSLPKSLYVAVVSLSHH